MTVLDNVKELLNAISPRCICDDCISQKLELTVRQHANHKTRQLAGNAGFKREKQRCSFCGLEKMSISSLQNRLSHGSTGLFDSQKWTTEGDGLLASSRKVQDTWEGHRAAFSQAIKQRFLKLSK